MISKSAYFLALNVFIFEIGKEILNNKELKQGHLEPIREETHVGVYVLKSNLLACHK